MVKIRTQDALDYHEQDRPGKIQVVPTKPYSSQRDLSLAYSPGVAEPVKAIAANPDDAYRYTAKGNLVAVISNGTAVLGLGDQGPLASKPVMEGKGLLFKIFADIDVFDIEVDATDPEHFVSVVKAIAPTFGGINLEDIKAPEAFEIERRLKEELDIPVMHDDQHGTAIISGAALINALEIAGKEIGKVRIVINGAGASAISCAKLYIALGVNPENLLMLDSKGVIHTDREDLDPAKQPFARQTAFRRLEECLPGADVFLGLSRGNIMNGNMVKTMAENPIVFALANPEPEISYREATAARKDIIMATGRSDHPNQVNNVLGFPYIFRGALDVRARSINEEMKLAAVRAIASLAKETVPEEVNEAYGQRNLAFGRNMIIPKPLDPRLITYVASAVARAAMESGVAQNPINDWEAYERELNLRLGLDDKLIKGITEKAKMNPQRVVFAEGDNYKVLKAAQIARDEGFAHPVLLGKRERILKIIRDNQLELDGVEIIDPQSTEEYERRLQFGEQYYAMRQRKGLTLYEANQLMQQRNYFGAMLVKTGFADALISGASRHYADVIRPALQIIGKEDDTNVVAGMYIMITKNKGPLFFADTTVNMNPDMETVVEIARLTDRTVRRLKIKPVIGMLSYSNFGSSRGEKAMKMKNAVKALHERHPEMVVDGEMQANFALNKAMLSEMFPFSILNDRKVNTLIFPDLASGNIAYKLVQEIGQVEAIGPVLMGMQKSFHVLQLNSSVREIVNMVRIAVVDAQTK
ncbi:MAG: NADP-dependent malic enzyme [Cryomorphaceae bacterium]|nr:MAG: NADP-dependent malic enzyme [Cryomorphaceae bacterium]